MAYDKTIPLSRVVDTAADVGKIAQVQSDGSILPVTGTGGSTGPTGAPGSVWYPGSVVPAGGTGINGDYYIRFNPGAAGHGDVYQKAAGAWGIVGNIWGPPGAQGIQGIQGIQGVQGNIGPTGPPGANGANGAAGATGPTGPAGTNGTGTVNSVALAAPGIFSVSGSPVTNTGTLTLGLATQTANTVFAAPNGSTGAPSFRTLVAADIPNLPASQITSGVLAIGRLATGTPDGTKFVRDDGTLATPAGGGGTGNTTTGTHHWTGSSGFIVFLPSLASVTAPYLYVAVNDSTLSQTIQRAGSTTDTFNGGGTSISIAAGTSVILLADTSASVWARVL